MDEYRCGGRGDTIWQGRVSDQGVVGDGYD